MLGKTLEGIFHSHFFEHVLHVLELRLLRREVRDFDVLAKLPKRVQ
jgi:hypothetical protein